MDISALLKKYDQPVPRYTSYPTAVHFNHDISQDHYTNRLENLDNKTPVSLYVHIPFCHILCHYCGCHTKVVNNYSPVKGYVETLIKEIEIVGKKLKGKPPISQLHFGGGSPNILEREEIEQIISTLKQYFDFAKNSEIAIDTDPRLLNKDKCNTLADLGFTRVSLGVQDFNKEVQKAVNRVQPFETVKDTVLNLRGAGINKINFDLMVGLPLQTLDGVKETVRQAITLSPNRLAIFAYAHVPWMKKHQKLIENLPMPNTQERFDMTQIVKEELENVNYHAIGIDHFAYETDSLYKSFKDHTLRRNFQGYTDDQAQDIISFGISSISMIGDSYIQNTTSAPDYKKSIEAGEIPIKRGCVLSKEDIQRRATIEQIMCGYNTNVSAYPESMEKLLMLEKDGLATIKDNHVQVTSNGWPFARIVASCIDTYYEPQEGQHAKAV